ncbi:hypothetical protein [Afifella pfennigii]|uniref:hypothetical protein n=1 Tax=Afifella pfennigii TaxID=209897 RepID=UPI00047CDA9A|nr:hypothetical protein [Afifella pfennigii]
MKYLRLALLALMLLPVSPAAAHKVIASLFVSGAVIEGEIGFTSGDMASDILVEVFDEAGNKLGETRTDADGFFTYAPEKAVTHVFRANLGAGHVAEVQMAAEELPEIAGSPAATVSAEANGGSGPPSASPAPASVPAPQIDLDALMEEQRRLIAEAVQKQVIPLRRDIDAYKEKHDLQSILGGIGYIFGLFGLGFYLAARRKMKAA